MLREVSLKQQFAFWALPGHNHQRMRNGENNRRALRLGHD
jgi:hypothetical protein